MSRVCRDCIEAEDQPRGAGMRFLVDAQLPSRLCSVLNRLGHDAIHTSSLDAGNRTTDNVVNQVAEEQYRVLITKDSDFYHSHVLRGAPPKLVLVRTGNIGVRDLCSMFESHMSLIVSALEGSSLLEIDRDSVRSLH